MNRAELLALADRCEAATGPDRALDFLILKRLRGLRDLGCGLYEMENWYYSLDNSEPSEKHPPFPSPTASLDAALTLVPEGWDWCLSRGTGEPAVASMSPADRVSGPCVTCATPALALCAAALRARATKEGA